jgi:hypothetical protein
MILQFQLKNIVPDMTDAVIGPLHATLGQKLAVSSALMELTVDLSDIYLHDCPPVSHFRVVMREAVWLREWRVAQGARADVGGVLALFSTTEDEPLETPPSREVRVMIAGVAAPAQNALW